MSWQLVEHTADVAIEAAGPTPGAAMDAAGLALTSVITGNESPHNFPTDGEMNFSLEAPDLESLLVAFLAELLWLAESTDMAWVGGGVATSITDDGLHALQATGNGTDLGRAPNNGVEVKAITYHDLSFQQRGAEWHLRALLDI